MNEKIIKVLLLTIPVTIILLFGFGFIWKLLISNILTESQQDIYHQDYGVLVIWGIVVVSLFISYFFVETENDKE